MRQQLSRSNRARVALCRTDCYDEQRRLGSFSLRSFKIAVNDKSLLLYSETNTETRTGLYQLLLDCRFPCLCLLHLTLSFHGFLHIGILPKILFVSLPPPFALPLCPAICRIYLPAYYYGSTVCYCPSLGPLQESVLLPIFLCTLSC